MMGQEEPSADARQFARAMRDMYVALVAWGFTSGEALTEEGRRLASEREDLIAQGVAPSRLAVPLAPGATRLDEVVCCDSHNGGDRVGGCCDPDDCGSCCENCPTCPTLIRQRLFPGVAEKIGRGYKNLGRRELALELASISEGRYGLSGVLDLIRQESEA